MTQQGDRQKTVRATTGTLDDYNGDWHALFTFAAIPLGDWDGRLLQWINLQLSRNFTEINGAMQAFAVANGAANWSQMGTFAIVGVSNALLMENGSNILLESGGRLLLEH